MNVIQILVAEHMASKNQCLRGNMKLFIFNCFNNNINTQKNNLIKMS